MRQKHFTDSFRLLSKTEKKLLGRYEKSKPVKKMDQYLENFEDVQVGPSLWNLEAADFSDETLSESSLTSVKDRGGSRQNHDIRTFLTIEPHPMTTPTKVMSVKLNWLQYIQGGIQRYNHPW